MRICSMTATFGCLDGETIRPEAGLTVLTQPNESGKSTWAAFMLAMFYGIDTSRRAARGRLPEKNRYQPWNGKPMSGTMELEHGGRRIVLQRTSQRGKPMGVFRAYDPDTGLDLPELTGENCGVVLLGVERSVYQRSAFVSGSETAVTEDQALAQRLENLAASGNVQDNYPAAAARLKLWKNRCRYHQNGLIPETEAKLRQAEGRMERLTALRQEAVEAAAEYEACKKEAEVLERTEREKWETEIQITRSTYLDMAQQLEQLEAEQARADDLWGRPEYLLRLQEDLQYLEENPLPPESACPPALQGIGQEALMPMAERDHTGWFRLREQEKIAADRWLRLALGCGLLAVAALIGTIWWALGLCLAGVAAGLWLRWSAVRKLRQAAAALLQSYGASEPEGILTVAREREKWLLLQERHQKIRWNIEEQLERLRETDDTITLETLTSARIQEACDRRRQLERLRQEIALAKAKSAGKQMPFLPGRELMALREKAAGLQARVRSLQQQETDRGGLEEAAYRCEQLRKELEMLYQREQAMELAQEALEHAHEQLAQVYAPQLTGLAGAYLQKLTGGRYDALIMGQDWSLQVRETTSGLVRPLAALSSGTQDQIWLAMRLAMTRLLLPDGVPIVLDDALVTFDEARTAAALDILRQENRQVILFTCKQVQDI